MKQVRKKPLAERRAFSSLNQGKPRPSTGGEASFRLAENRLRQLADWADEGDKESNFPDVTSGYCVSLLRSSLSTATKYRFQSIFLTIFLNYYYLQFKKVI